MSHMNPHTFYDESMVKLATDVGLQGACDHSITIGNPQPVVQFIENLVDKQKILCDISKLEQKVDEINRLLKLLCANTGQLPTTTQLALPSSLEPVQCIEPIYSASFIEDHSIRITNKEVGEGLAFIHFVILDQYKKSSTGRAEFKLKDTKTFLLEHFEKIEKTQEGFVTYNRFPVRLKPQLEGCRQTYKMNQGKKKK